MATYSNIRQAQRKDTAAAWTSANPTLDAGEIGFETDTGKLKIGDGSTAWTSLSYIRPSGAGTNYTSWDSTGHQTMAGTARPWRDALTDALSLQQNGAGISRNATESTVDFAHNATWNATFTLADAMYLNVQLNHDRDHASLIYPHIHWFQAANYSPNWLLEYRWQKNGGGTAGTLTKVTSWTELACNNLAFNWSTKTGGSGTLHQISYSAGISPPTGSDISDIIQFRIYRDTTGASTTYTGVTCPYNTGGNRTAAVMAFDCHFQINSLGSTDEYTK